MLLTTLKTIHSQSQFRLKRRHLIDLGKKAHEQLEHELIGDTFIFASSNTGHYHHGFGRDTAFNAWFLDIAYRKTHGTLWQKTKKALLTYWTFQQPDGKIPHELKPYDPEDELGKKGFYDRYKEYYINRDSVDATPLMLIVTPLYVSKDEPEFQMLLPKILSALSWMEKNMDEHYGWLSYEGNPKGLVSQGWMDSVHGGAVDERGNLIDGVIALVEAQAFVWKAFLEWADILNTIYPEKAYLLREKAAELKERFNNAFGMTDSKGKYLSHALIVDKRTGLLKAKLDRVSINPGLCLWASYKGDTIIDKDIQVDVVERLLSSDMFDPRAGIFTFAKGYALKNGDGYHNGEKVVWPFASVAVGYGILELGSRYTRAGRKILAASVMPILKSGSFIEQARFENGAFQRYQVGDYISCKDQTWTVTAFVASLTTLGIFDKVFVEKSGFPRLLQLPIQPLKKVLVPPLQSVSHIFSS